ncbi:MAG: CoA transferase [Proteobacteria bacterium]|nr:CoA transferase [Desulfobulbaceae bacterium]MBU4152219.1 CoA transferase [Pseudomonadota bacterium]
MSSGALADLKVLDLTHYIAGPYCTKLLAGFGAEVLKIERPGTGDPLRSVGPFTKGCSDIEMSIPFLWLNTGKKSVALDLKSAPGLEYVKKLIAWADVLVENFAPGVMMRLGLDYETIQAINPRLIMTSVSNFGQVGPYRDCRAEEITLYAMSGQMNATGDPDREPLAPGLAINQYTAGLHAYIGTLAALHHREKTGEGQHVDISLHESGVDNIEIGLINFLHQGIRSRRSKHIMVPWRNYPCKDGMATVICAPFRHWVQGARLFEAPELLQEKYHHVRGRHVERERVEELIQPWISSKTREDIFHAGQQQGLAFGYRASLAEALALPQHLARDFFVKTDDGRGGSYNYPGAPFKLSATPWHQERAPLLGEHTAAVLSRTLKLDRAEPDQLGAAGVGEGFKQAAAEDASRVTPRGALTGIRVLDLTHSWAGPHGTRILADLGAEVIKIEYLPRLCLLRAGIVKDQMYNKRPMWFQVNRGKRSVTLDMNNPEELETFLDLVRISDVVVENARGGVLERRGLDYHSLVKVKSDIIFLSMAAFGKTGPYASYAGYGATMEALSGAESLTGYYGSTETKRVREIDVTNGIFGAAAVLTALHHREKTGKGQWIDLSQLETVSHGLIGEHLLAFAMNGIVPPVRGNRHERFAPCGCYPSLGEDRWVTLVIRNDREWLELCELIDRPALSNDPRLQTVTGRMAHHDEIDRAIAEWTSAREAGEVQDLLQSQGIAAGAVMNVEDLSRDPHLVARGFLVTTSDGGEELYPGNPIRLSRDHSPPAWRGPDLGRDNEYVLCSLLGRSQAEVPHICEDDLGTALDP